MRLSPVLFCFGDLGDSSSSASEHWFMVFPGLDVLPLDRSLASSVHEHAQTNQNPKDRDTKSDAYCNGGSGTDSCGSAARARG